MTIPTWVVVAGAIGLVAQACVKSAPPPEPVLMTPQSRLIFHDTNGHAIWSQCDRGHRIYANSAGQFQVVPNGCPTGEP